MRLRLSTWRGALLIGALFAFLQIPSAPGHVSPDTSNYAGQALRVLDTPGARLADEVIGQRCDQQLRLARERHALNVMEFRDPLDERAVSRHCFRVLRAEALVPLPALMGPPGRALAPANRCEAIFLSRPGYAYAVVPFVAAFGLTWGMWGFALLVTLAGGVLVLLFLRVAGAAVPAALLGQALYYVLPTGYWSMRPLAEGLVLALSAAVLLGLALVWRGRRRAGCAVTAGAFAAGFAVKYSLFLMLGGWLALACAVGLLAGSWDRRGDGVTALALTGGAVALTAAGVRLLGWPGADDSVMELFTNHCRLPDVPDAWQQWRELSGSYWPLWIRDRLTEPLPLLVWAAGAWWSLRRPGAAGLFVVATALCGLATQAAHPDAGEADRLYVHVWFLVVCGVPFAVDRYARHLFPAEVEEVERCVPPPPRHAWP
ncbi:hypothetical protein [Streptomyces sp. NBC_01465]|uniref:hypothetical protein n=1 Tax=Streptomyces sp. NBC_01465 TaxID=2903878 RepID=UPI002E300A09|nr:hypothetical protein [Streptomyces sp. NBC_01465]